MIVRASLAVLLASISTTVEAQSFQPLDVFDRVCVDGEASFPTGAIVPVEAKKIHTKARQLAMLTLWTSAYDYDSHRAVSPAEMPSAVYRFPEADRKTFLATPDEEPENPIAASCSVFTKGNLLDEASERLAKASGEAVKTFPGKTVMVTYLAGQHLLVAASLDGWTIIAAVPTKFYPGPYPSSATTHVQSN